MNNKTYQIMVLLGITLSPTEDDYKKRGAMWAT